MPNTLNLKYEWTYSCIERVEENQDNWSGVYAGRGSAKQRDGQAAKVGAAREGRIRGGVVVAHNEQEALDLIKELHAERIKDEQGNYTIKVYKSFEIIDLNKRGAVFD